MSRKNNFNESEESLALRERYSRCGFNRIFDGISKVLRLADNLRHSSKEFHLPTGRFTGGAKNGGVKEGSRHFSIE